MSDSTGTETSKTELDKPSSGSGRRSKARWTKTMIFLRRFHLYAGLFLLPWVFLYGITGAMYNHQWLLPEVSMQPFPPSTLAGAPVENFPVPAELAEKVVDAIEEQAGDVTIEVDSTHAAEFTNNVMYEVLSDGNRYVVEINPVDHSSNLIKHPPATFKPKKLLGKVQNIDLQPSPIAALADSVPTVLQAAGIENASTPKPLGWSKLNFVATVDGQPARVTYVLKDGHVELSHYTGEPGMSLRSFFMRLHTTHGQGPHWNGRMFWTLILDAMAFAMVCWGMTGLLMWWQIKRTRRIGAAVLALSLLTAVFLFLSVQDFYATTLL